jgi:RNA polymerase sigma-70 factor (ECF subfamily)
VTASEKKNLQAQFEANRPRLRAVAYRMLGSTGDADDALQEAWLKLESATTAIANPTSYLTTIVARVCLDLMKSKKSRREDELGEGETLPTTATPEQDVMAADALGPALLLVLDTLEPPERLAFVLHDMFAMPFDEIAPIAGKTPAATRQLASRARKRVQDADKAKTAADVARKQAVVAAFLAASRAGDFEALLSLLDPNVVFRADEASRKLGAMANLVGAETIAKNFMGRAQGAKPAIVDGLAAIAARRGDEAWLVFELRFDEIGTRITHIEMATEPETIAAMEVELA